MNNINQYSIHTEIDELDLRKIIKIIFKYKYFISIFVLISTILAIIYGISKPNEYKVYTVLVPQGVSKSSNFRRLASFASFSGMNIKEGIVTPDIAFKALINDYDFMKKFIISKHIDKKLFNNNLEKDYVFVFHGKKIYDFLKNHKKINKRKINFFLSVYRPMAQRFNISMDEETGIITMSFTHPSRHFAYYVLTSFLEDGSAYLANKDIQEINTQIDKYQKELQKTDNIELKSMLAKLISSLIKQKVYINSSKYYNVKIITDPYIPDKNDKVKPKRGLIVIISFIISFGMAIILVFLIEFIKKIKKHYEH